MRLKLFCVGLTLLSVSCTKVQQHDHDHSSHSHDKNTKQWLAGDHHIHGTYSAKWDNSVTPPAPIIGGDAIYTTQMNAQMAHKHGLSWMVTTDHGGPNHSKLNLTQAYPDLLASRKAVPDIIQFYGMELNTPGAEHSSLIIPHSHDEAEQLHNLEKSYDIKEAHPVDPQRNTEEQMLVALADMESQTKQPIVIVNHPGRTAKDLGVYTKVTPTELRNWNNAAPTVAIGMAGSPGHQAVTLKPNGEIKQDVQRGRYRGFPTMGGFDQMTARLSGFWDSMLGEGRHWWVTAASDSHKHYTDGGQDFWPGEFSKTYIHAAKNYDDILENFRKGHVFVTTGDLLSELYVTVSVNHTAQSANIGDTLMVNAGDTVMVQIKFLDPESNNARGENPQVNHVDIITGKVMGLLIDKSVDTNPTTQVIGRFYQDNWQQDNQYQVINYTIKNIAQDSYLRVRGTNTEQLEPQPDEYGEDPWSDLWFYSNPIFIKVN